LEKITFIQYLRRRPFTSVKIPGSSSEAFDQGKPMFSTTAKLPARNGERQRADCGRLAGARRYSPTKPQQASGHWTHRE
jgi:hypothetical protein